MGILSRDPGLLGPREFEAWRSRFYPGAKGSEYDLIFDAIYESESHDWEDDTIDRYLVFRKNGKVVYVSGEHPTSPSWASDLIAARDPQCFTGKYTRRGPQIVFTVRGGVSGAEVDCRVIVIESDRAIGLEIYARRTGRRWSRLFSRLRGAPVA